jgi:hypothetical protein
MAYYCHHFVDAGGLFSDILRGEKVASRPVQADVSNGHKAMHHPGEIDGETELD